MESEKSDIELMDKIRQGDMTAFGLLYARYADLIYRHILVRVNSSFDADDIFQSFFPEPLGKKRFHTNKHLCKRIFVDLAKKFYIEYHSGRTNPDKIPHTRARKLDRSP